MRITVRHLEAFCEVAQSGSFSVAAQRLHLTQPSLSASIKNLEFLTSAKLFDRDNRRVTLTPLGEELLPLALRVLSEFDRSMRDLQDHVASRRGQVRLAAIPALFPSVLPPTLSEYRARYPNISMSVRDLLSQEALDHLRKGLIDMALVALTEMHEDLQALPFCRHSLVLLMPPSDPLAGASDEGVAWREALQGPLVKVNPGGNMGRLSRAALALHGIELPDSHSVENLMAAVGLVQAGLARAVVSNLSAHSLTPLGLVYRPLIQPEISTPLWLVTRRGHTLSPAAEALHAMLSRTERA